jgi:uncharacterized protein YodC (DUF2158 family)
MNGIKIGDIVYLKSGSPKMTIGSIDKSSVTCVWFNGTQKLEGFFNPESLTKENPISVSIPSSKTKDFGITKF